MTPNTPGLHHVTAIAGDPGANAEFYVDVLGLRFVKRTVNHDDTGTYHFYFGDREGTPGTTVTFFPWTSTGRQGEFGTGQPKTTAYRIPADAVDYWVDRLESHGVDVERTERFGDTVLSFADPDGIELALVASGAADAAVTPWPDGPVPEAHQLRGFHGVTLAVASVDRTASVLEGVLGYEHVDERNDRHRYRPAGGGDGSVVDLLDVDAERGRTGVGTVHHVAFKARDVEEQEAYREAFAERDLEATAVIDRTYFESIYCREPGGVLFEIATMAPGFTVDETVEDLGGSLQLPERLESERESIEADLPAFEAPEATR